MGDQTMEVPAAAVDVLVAELYGGRDLTDDQRAWVEAALGKAAVHLTPALSDLGASEGTPYVKGSATSLSAARLAWPKQGDDRERIVRWLALTPGTRDEVATGTGLSPNTVRPRTVELLQGGWVQVKTDRKGDPVKRKTPAGRAADVLELTFAARTRLRSAG